MSSPSLPTCSLPPGVGEDRYGPLYAQARQCFDREELAQAQEICEFILQYQAQHIEALHLLALVYAQGGNLPRAADLLEQAIAMDPAYAPAHANLGRVLTWQGRLDAAKASFQRALTLTPNDAATHNNLGNLHLQERQLSQALASYKRAMALNPQDADAMLNQAIALLLSGDLAAGWPMYEWRWKRARPTSPLRHFTQPLWLGEQDLQGKTLLLHAEQGLGDTLQFCRYVPLAAARGARVVLEAPATLMGVLATLSGVSQWVVCGQPLPAFDLHCPLLSLPLAFKTTLQTIPSPRPYLRSDPTRVHAWAQRLGPRTRARIGLVWSGNAQHSNDAQRSLSLAQMLSFLPEDCEYVSLHKEIRPADLKTLREKPQIRYFGSDLEDFVDTAALCSLMDLIISVDTSVAHLAGALGRPTWLLLPYVPDWRWMLQRNDSPWYPSMTLFRQTTHGIWDTPLQSIRHQLTSVEQVVQSASALMPLPVASTSPNQEAIRSAKQPQIEWDALITQAQEFVNKKEWEPAQEICEFILRNSAKQAEALHLMGVIAINHQNLDIAEDFFRRTLEIQPDHSVARANLGHLLNERNKYEEAALHLQQAISSNPRFAAAYNNLGNSFLRIQRRDAALTCFEQALELKSDYPEAWFNRGVTLRELQQLPEAIKSYEKAIALKPDYVEAHWNKAVALLLSGDMAAGWPQYEWRWKYLQSNSLRNFSQPLWLGKQNLQGKTLLLHAEQGLGDTLQFCRYAPMVAALGARVVLEAPAALMGLLSSLQGVNEFVESGQPLPNFDFHCPLMSLPLAFKTTLASIPFPGPYLRSDPNQAQVWKLRLGPKTRPRVGLVWSGNALHTKDSQRSLRLEQLITHLPENCEYVSLQKEIREADVAALSSHLQLRHFGDELRDFSDTAALCDLMDLVISVDTSVAHLSGALGRTTWLLVAYVPDWRWLLNRNDSPWYSSMRLYRQSSDETWDLPLKTIARDLTSLKNDSVKK